MPKARIKASRTERRLRRAINSTKEKQQADAKAFLVALRPKARVGDVLSPSWDVWSPEDHRR